MKDEVELTVTQTFSELQLAKENSIQAIPLSNEEYVKQLEDEQND